MAKKNGSANRKTSSANGSKTAANGSKAFEQAFTKSKDQFESAFRASAEKASTTFYKNYGDMAVQSKDALDALMESTTRLTQGAQEINSAMLSWTQQSLEAGMSTCKDLMDCKSFQDVIDLQTSYARNFIEGMLSEGTRLSEMSVRVANEAFEPVKDRVNAQVERFLKNAA
jgi:phasin family protein